MDNPPPKMPWHKRNLTESFPRWLPPWVLVCLGCSLLGGLFGYFAGRMAPNPQNPMETFLIGAVIGFGLSMVVGWMMWLRGLNLGFPNWLGYFLLIGVVIGFGYFAIKDRIVTAGGRYGRKIIIFEGTSAVLFGYLLIVVGGILSVWMLRRVPRTGSMRFAGILGLITMVSTIVWLQIRG